MKNIKSIMAGFFMVVTAVGMTATTAQSVTLTYDFPFNTPNGTPVTDIVLYAAGVGQDSVNLSPATLPASGGSQLTHTVNFEPFSALIVGITKRTTEEKWDLIFFTSNTYATSAVGQLFNELFPRERNPRHSELISLLQMVYNGDANSLDAVTSFLRGPDAVDAYFDPFGSYLVGQFTGFQILPEPNMLALFGLGLAGLGFTRRRKAA